MIRHTEAELRALGERERAEIAQRDARYVERQRRRHRRMGLIAVVLTLPMLLILQGIDGVPLAGWLVEPAMGGIGAWLISRFQPNILVSGILVGALLILGMAFCAGCGWWHTNPLQALFAALGVGLAMLGAGTIALHVDLDDP